MAKYGTEFKNKVVACAMATTYREAANKYDVSQGSISRWKKKIQSKQIEADKEDKLEKIGEKLTDKQKTFVDEYLIDLNGKQAAIRAGYSEKTAEQQASRLLSNVKVEEYKKRIMKEREKRTEITQDRVLEELAKIGFADINDFLEFRTEKTVIDRDMSGNPIIDYANIIQLKDSDEVDGAVVSEVQLKDGNLKFKLHDKMKALNDIGRHLGMFTDKVEHSGDMAINIINDIPKNEPPEMD